MPNSLNHATPLVNKYKNGKIFSSLSLTQKYNSVKRTQSNNEYKLYASQAMFVNSTADEVLFSGGRGGGKTDSAFIKILQNINQGHEHNFTALVVRKDGDSIDEMIGRFKEMASWFGDYSFHGQKKRITFASGEVVKFAIVNHTTDYEIFKGRELSMVYVDEASSFRDIERMLEIFSGCLRNSRIKGWKGQIIMTTNPDGEGSMYIKKNYIDFLGKPGAIREAESGRTRQFFHSVLTDNKVLHGNSPYYLRSLQAIRDPARRAAWLEGSWDHCLGGYFNDFWNPDIHVVDAFKIPNTWFVNRSFDWGSSSPFSVCYWAQSDGTSYTDKHGEEVITIKGDLFLFDEYYGSEKMDNVGLNLSTPELAININQKDSRIRSELGLDVYPGPADPSIFGNGRDATTIYNQMRAHNVSWTRGDNARVASLTKLRELFVNAETRDGPGIFIFRQCEAFIQTVPVIPRDKHRPEDVDTKAQDHVLDAVRYRIYNPPLLDQNRKCLPF